MKKLVVCLLWHGLDSANLGVRALTESQLHLVRDAAQKAGRDVSFEVVGWAASTNPGQFKALGVERVTPVNFRSMLSSKGVRAAFQRSAIVLDIGEGDSFSDIYDFKRLLYFCMTKFFVVATPRPLILSPQTIGPFSKWWSRIMSDLCLRKATFIFPRDELSKSYLESRNLSTPYEEIVDVAFALPFERPVKQDCGTIRVGINVSGLLWSGGYTQNNQFGLALDFPALMRRLVRYFFEQEQVEIYLVPHVIAAPSIIDGDTGACATLAAEFPGVKVAPVFDGPSAAKSFISGLDFFVGARMHACIAAFSSGVPVVPLAYSRKFRGLFNTLGYHRVADCQAQSEQEIFDLVVATYRHRKSVELEIRRGNEFAKARLSVYLNKLVELLAKS